MTQSALRAGLVCGLCLAALSCCGGEHARRDADAAAGDAHDDRADVEVECDFDCECAALPTVHGAGYKCYMHRCRELGVPAVGICWPGYSPPTYCACRGGMCDGAMGRSCCRLPDGTIAGPDDAECQP